MRLLAKEETPSDWISKKIGFYVLGHKGGAALRPNDFSNTGFPVIPKKAIQPTGELLIENPTYCTNEFASNNKRSIVDSSYAITTLRDLVPTGPTIGTVVNFSNEEKYILSQGVYGLKLNDALDKHYLSYLSNTAFYRKVMQRIMVGSTQVHIRTPEYLDLEIQIPPLPEQQKIAKILSTWDKAISNTERLIENSTQQKKALMQQLLTGKKRLLDNEGKRFEGEWSDNHLHEVAKIIVSPVNKKTVEGEIPVELCNYTDVYYNIRITNSLEFMKATAKQSEIDRYTLQVGDVIITKDSETPGDIAIPALVSEDLGGVVCGYHLAIIRPNKKLLEGAFLNYLLSMPETRYYFFTLANGATRFGLSIGSINNAHFSLPPLKEQQKIATVLTNTDKEIDLLEQQLADLQQEKKALMQVLLTGKRRVLVDGES